ncbi:putative Glyco_trans_2-like domain-containing protein [Vibrio owensii]|nr:putative Glyco_trans_2-like domain-containing protein [Vibrio owensii]
MNNTKFSIIVPFYNAQDFLKDTILSVINNNYKEIEIILIDDGSTDLSSNISHEIIRAYPELEIVLLEQHNQGPNVARNLGIDSASGDYVIFIDADDLLDKDCFHKLNYCINDHDYICYGIDFFDNENGNVISKRIPGVKNYDNDAVIQEAFGNNCLLGICWNKCISLSFLNRNNIRFTPDKLHGRDIIFSRECALYASSVASIDSILCHSRFHRGSFSRSFSNKNITSAIDLAERHLTVFSDKVDTFKLKVSINRHLNYILFLSSFRSETFIKFREHHDMISKAKRDLEIENCNVNFRQKVISTYLSFKLVTWFLSRSLLSIGYKPY